MGAERRRHKRHRKRIKVRYGTKAFEHTAFSTDVSLSGMFISSLPAPALDTRLHLELVDSKGQISYLEGIVQRVVNINPGLRQVAHGGFGVRFLTPEELLRDFLPLESLQLAVRYSTQEELINALPDLRRGGLFLQAVNPPPVNTVLSVTVEALWKKASLDLLCRVVHVTEGSGSRGVSLVFSDPAQAIARILKLAELPPG